MKTAVFARSAVGAVLVLAALACGRPSAGADGRAGLMLVDGEPQLFFLACEGETVEAVEVWSNTDGDRVVIEPDDDDLIWSTDMPSFDTEGRFSDAIDLPDDWWLEDTQVQFVSSDAEALVIVTGVEALEPDQLWSSSLLVPPEEFPDRAAASC